MKTIAATLTRLRPWTPPRSAGRSSRPLLPPARGLGDEASWVARSGSLERFEAPTLPPRPADAPIARAWAFTPAHDAALPAPRGAVEIVLHVLGYR